MTVPATSKYGGRHKYILAVHTVRERPVDRGQAPKEQILPGISQAPLPLGTGDSEKQACPSRLAQGESRLAGETLRPMTEGEAHSTTRGVS
ncbi:hypothetical protein GCM10018954_038910 [Kutzneria kofuensis]